MEIPAAVEKSFEIEVDGGTINATFRQATMGDDMTRASLFSERKTSREGGSITEVYNMDWLRLAATEVRLTLVECDITVKDKKVLKKGMNEASFMKVWEQLPLSWGDKLHKRCLEVNPDWDFLGGQADASD